MPGARASPATTFTCRTTGGAYQLFLGGTTGTSATFIGTPGHKYSFFSIATDEAGNVEASPSGAGCEHEDQRHGQGRHQHQCYNLDQRVGAGAIGHVNRHGEPELVDQQFARRSGDVL